MSFARPLARAKRKPPRELTKEEAAEIQQAFDLFDADRSGRIDYRELKKEVLEILAQYDKDGADQVDFSEFRRIMQDKYVNRSFDDLLQRAFEVFDVDATGKIRLRNLKAIARDVGENISEDELQDMIDMFDSNGDGVIDRAEFRNILKVYNPLEDEDND